MHTDLISRAMTYTRLSVLLAALALVTAGCDSVLDVEPSNEVPADKAITDVESARAAASGMYDALQSGSYYGGDYVLFQDLSADNAWHSGTFTDYADADANDVTADNGTIAGIWQAMYRTINRANVVIERVPGVPNMDPDEADQLVGEAYALRGLTYFNLVRLFGDVPIRLTPTTDVEDIAGLSRSPVSAVFTQVTNDLNAALSHVSNESNSRRVSRGFVWAVRARVALWQQNWAAAEAAADSVESYGYTLAQLYRDLFSADGSDTPEDILRISFTAQDYNNLGFYYVARALGGRREQAPEWEIIELYDPNFDHLVDPLSSYDPVDQRGAWSIDFDGGGRRYVKKFPTVIGAEDIHVVRFAEILLIRAEAHARQNELLEALQDLNRVRRRAGLADLVLGVDVTTQAQVLAAIWAERRLELAFEGDRWSELVRLGQAVSVLGLQGREYQVLYPIPQRERDVSSLTQNPGY